MAKPSKKPRDINQRAFSIVQQVTGDIPKASHLAKKHPAAVALGRLGGLKRSQKLSATRRKSIARKAARSRWKK